MPDSRSELTLCFAAVFPGLHAEEIPLASRASVAAWDSLAFVRLISVVEEAFDIAIEPGDEEHLVSFDLFLDYVRSQTDDS
jgi:acyl carrier protein